MVEVHSLIQVEVGSVVDLENVGHLEEVEFVFAG